MLTLATKFRPDTLQAFDAAFQAGFRCAEFWLDDALLSNWKTIASTARKYRFCYALHFPNSGVRHSDSLKCAVSLYSELQCRAMVMHQPMYDEYGDDLLAIEPSLHLAVENHDFDAAEFDRWAEGNCWLTLDVEHLWMVTLKNAPLEKLLARLARFLSQHGKKLRHVHLPGYKVGGEEHLPIHHSAEMAARVLGLLADCGYSEFVVSEADKPYQNLAELRQDVAMFEDWRKQYAAHGR
jgi:hypothetical protein